MKSSRTWPWVVGAAVAGIAVGLILGRTGQASAGRSGLTASEPRPVQAPTASAVAPSARPVVAPSVPAPRNPDPAPTAPPAKPAPDEAVAAENTTLTPPPPDEWEKIPIDKAFGESLGSFPTRKAFSKGMMNPETFLPCVKQWKAPPQLDKVELETELRVRSEEGALVVEDVVILDGNVADAALETCVIEGYRGRRIPVSGVEPGRRYRLKWGGVAALR